MSDRNGKGPRSRSPRPSKPRGGNQLGDCKKRKVKKK